MTGTEETEALTDHQYFQAIEEVFVRLRGAPLLLPPKDWQTARAWHREGIPLDLVLRTVEEVFERRRERGEEQKVLYLRYCDRAVRGAWEEARELTAAAAARRAEGVADRGGGGLDVGRRLDALAGSLPGDLPGRAELAEGIRRLGSAGTDAGPSSVDERRVEKELAALDRETVEGLIDALDPERRAVLDAEVGRAMAGLAARLPRDEGERARARLLQQKVRRIFGLPTLSLFAPEADPERSPGAGS